MTGEWEEIKEPPKPTTAVTAALVAHGPMLPAAATTAYLLA